MRTTQTSNKFARLAECLVDASASACCTETRRMCVREGQRGRLHASDSATGGNVPAAGHNPYPLLVTESCVRASRSRSRVPELRTYPCFLSVCPQGCIHIYICRFFRNRHVGVSMLHDLFRPKAHPSEGKLFAYCATTLRTQSIVYFVLKYMT